MTTIYLNLDYEVRGMEEWKKGSWDFGEEKILEVYNFKGSDLDRIWKRWKEGGEEPIRVSTYQKRRGRTRIGHLTIYKMRAHKYVDMWGQNSNKYELKAGIRKLDIR